MILTPAAAKQSRSNLESLDIDASHKQPLLEGINAAESRFLGLQLRTRERIYDAINAAKYADCPRYDYVDGVCVLPICYDCAE